MIVHIPFITVCINEKVSLLSVDLKENVTLEDNLFVYFRNPLKWCHVSWMNVSSLGIVDLTHWGRVWKTFHEGGYLEGPTHGAYLTRKFEELRS